MPRPKKKIPEAPTSPTTPTPELSEAEQELEATESDFLKNHFTDLSLKQRAALKAWLKNLGHIPSTVKDAGITRSTWYEWKKKDETFQQALELLDQMDADDLEHHANRYARDGDTTLIIFLLKAKRREKYDDKFAQMLYQEKKGILDPDNAVVPVRPVLVRGEEPQPGKEAAEEANRDEE